MAGGLSAAGGDIDSRRSGRVLTPGSTQDVAKSGQEQNIAGMAGVNAATQNINATSGRLESAGANSAAAMEQTAAEAANQAAQAGATASGSEARAGRQLGAAEASMGSNAAEYMGKATQAAQGQAEQAAQAGSTAAARQALAAARSGGVNRGQAALMAARGAGDTYSQQYQGGLESGRSQYQSATNQFQQAGQSAQQAGLQGRGQQMQGTAMQGSMQQGAGAMRTGSIQAAGGLQAQAGGLQSGIMQTGAGLQSSAMQTQSAESIAAAERDARAQQADMDRQQRAEDARMQREAANRQGMMGMAGGIISAGLGLISDERQKENIEPSDAIGRLLKKATPVDEIAQAVQPVKYNYREGSGEDTGKQRLGVLAQDLEKTSMRDNVVDTPRGKMIDVPQQTLSNTNLIAEMAQRLKKVEDEQGMPSFAKMRYLTGKMRGAQ